MLMSIRGQKSKKKLYRTFFEDSVNIEKARSHIYTYVIGNAHDYYENS